MLTILILLALAIVLSPFAMIPLLRRAATLAEDEANDGPARAVFTPDADPDLTLRGVRGLEHL